MINGVISVPTLAVMMLVAGRKEVMGALAVRGPLKALGWICTAVMALAVTAMFATI